MKRHHVVLAAIVALTAEKGYPPSLDEIAERSGLAGKSSVDYQVRKLARMGWIAYERGKPRTITVLKSSNVGSESGRIEDGPARSPTSQPDLNPVPAATGTEAYVAQ